MTNKEPIFAKHFCNPGDLVATLPSFKSFYLQNGKKIILAQQLNVKSEYYPGAVHPTTDENGAMVCMNKGMFDFMRPLVVSQEYMADMQVYDGQAPIYIDIDIIRKKIFVNLPHGDIQSWPFYAFPDLAYDLSEPWIDLPEKDIPIIPWVKDKILINFTERYRNGHIQYYFLRKYKNRLVFAGTEREHLLFCNAWSIDMPRLEVKDALELAYAIKYCKYLLCNQSLCWGISRAMKTPHVLEVCQYAQNCLPFHYKGSYGFLHQLGVENYCDILTV